MLNYDFNGDTTAPVCREIMEKLNEINYGNMFGYSQDTYTKQARELIQKEFSKPVDIHFVSSGSGANILAIKQLKDNYSSIICCENSHLNQHEVGGTEYNTGCKLITVKSKDAKLTIKDIKKKLSVGRNFNYSIPRIVVLSQASELGTVYTNNELKNICDFAHSNGLFVFVDGVRLANAIVNQKTTLKEMMEDTGVDAFSFGGNKNGAMFGDLLIFFDKKLSKNFIHSQKQSLMLFSKSRYLAAQFISLFEKDLWKKNAKHSNNMAKYLEQELKKIKIYPALQVQSNAVFANLTLKQRKLLSQKYALSVYESDQEITRLMTNWATTKKQVDELISYLKDINIKLQNI